MRFFKIRQQRERSYSKSIKRENEFLQNPSREREELLKIQQQRACVIQKPSRSERVAEREREKEEKKKKEDYIVIGEREMRECPLQRTTTPPRY